MPIFKITFTDNTIFEGGDSIYDSKWKDIPSKEILCLEYFIDEHESVTLRNYESYNYFIEATNNIYGPKGTDLTQQLHNIYLMGIKDGKVVSRRISLVGIDGTDKYLKGDSTKRTVELGKEFRGKPTVGWKKGTK
jgi:hypothetical protein